jgi:hypothetical protein
MANNVRGAGVGGKRACVFVDPHFFDQILETVEIPAWKQTICSKQRDLKLQIASNY